MGIQLIFASFECNQLILNRSRWHALDQRVEQALLTRLDPRQLSLRAGKLGIALSQDRIALGNVSRQKLIIDGRIH
ncbi:hypothetical protein [Acidiphilium sp. MT5]